MAAPKKREINLLKYKHFEDTLAGKVLAWVLSAGRVIVIITEIIVIAAFLSRFWLDRNLADLNEQNAALKAQVEAFSSFEKEFRSAQERLSLYKNLSAAQAKYSQIIKEVTSLLPTDVLLTNISITGDAVNITGKAISENGLAGFINAAGRAKTVKDIKLADLSLETKEQQLINFSLVGKPGGTSGGGN